LGNYYANVKQKWIVVHSTPAQQRAKKSIAQEVEIGEGVKKSIKLYKAK